MKTPDFETSDGILLWSITDAILDIDLMNIFSFDEEKVFRWLKKHQINDPVMKMPCHAFLMFIDHEYVLFDTGFGKEGQHKGYLYDALSDIGVEPDQIQHIMITHMHPDHIGGLALNKEPYFRHATVHVPKKEYVFWLDDANAGHVIESQRNFFDLAKKSLMPYERLDQISVFSTCDILPHDIHAIDWPGHSPGHTGYVLNTTDQPLLIWGDIIHSLFQLEFPECQLKMDYNAEEGVRSRLASFSYSINNQCFIAGSHAPKSGLGSLSKSNKQLRWNSNV